VLVYLLRNGNLKPLFFEVEGKRTSLALVGEFARDEAGGVCGTVLGMYEGVRGQIASLTEALAVCDGAVEEPLKDNCCIALVIDMLRNGFMLDAVLAAFINWLAVDSRGLRCFCNNIGPSME
jgi:hypothetical protein